MKNKCLIFTLLMLMAGSVSFAQYNIYPKVKEQLVIDINVSFSEKVFIYAEKGIDDVTVERARQILSEHGLKPEVAKGNLNSGCSGIFLGINSSHGVADRNLFNYPPLSDRSVFNLDKYDRHILSFVPDKFAQVVIVGENTDAVFCGLASLEQILDNGTSDLQCVTIYDYADVKERGIIEGYYGVPYSASVTKDLFRFMARYKMNTYMYGAKSDSYHSRYWAEPYPVEITEHQKKIGYLTQDMMKDIAETATANKVNFIWAIHPGKAFADPENKEVIDKIMEKFLCMYNLGVREFGVFVDDVGVPSEDNIMALCAENLTKLQNRIDEKWNRPEASPEAMVKPLHYVPQLYAYSWVSEERAQKFFESLSSTPEKVNIYITGCNVWSVPNNQDLKTVEKWLGRKVSWWWNYPCNDQDMTKIYVMDTYSNFRDETHILSLSKLEDNLEGANSVIINPMQQGELSKIALFGVADYTWNNEAFHNERNWVAATDAVLGVFAADFRKAAPYLRYYDNDALAYYVDRYKQSVKRGKPAPGTLIEELTEVNNACTRLCLLSSSKNESDRLFYEDLRPWLLKLKAMSAEAVALLKGENPAPVDYKSADFKFEILGGMGEHISLAERYAEPSNVILMPFIEWLRNENNK
ncbi:MAG: beta-N-acetylglucosaminidase domain-containing protein [Bacteroidales bacterium]|nr:beta-N-acetylglucosaminidase domain-containing protein [Bacteroidales bacterium]